MTKDSNILQDSPTGVYIFTTLQSGFHSIESGEEADGSNGEEGEEGIAPMEENGVGGDDVACGVTTTECDEAEMLLQEAEHDAQDEAAEGSDAGDEPSFAGEDALDERRVGSQVAECADLCLLVDDEHREGSNGIKRGNEQDEEDEEEGEPLLDLHDAVGIGLLFVLGKDGERGDPL